MSKKKKTDRYVDPEIVEEARSHPEFTHIRLGSKEYAFLLNMYGAEIARDEGHDPIPAIFRAIERLVPAVAGSDFFEKAMKEGRAVKEEDVGYVQIVRVIMSALDGQLIDDLCLVIWWGMLTFHPEVPLARVKLNLTPASIRNIFQTVWPKMLSYAQDLTEEDVFADDGSAESGEESGN